MTNTKNESNVMEGSELSITTDSFIQKLSENQQLTFQLMKQIVEKEKQSVKFLLDISEGINTQKLERTFDMAKLLNDYGFYTEALGLIKLVEQTILEVTPYFAVWFYKALSEIEFLSKGYEASIKAKPNKIYLEAHHTSQNEKLVFATWCILGNENDIKPLWHESVFRYSSLEAFVLSKYGSLFIHDDCDYKGDHVQKEIELTESELASFVQETQERYIKEYIEGNNELINL